MRKLATDIAFAVPSENLDIAGSIVRWDNTALGYPIGQRNGLEIRDNAQAMLAFQLFEVLHER